MGAVSPAALAQLPAAGALLRELLPVEPGDEAHGIVFAQVSALLFHAFRFWQHGRIVCRFDEAALRPLLLPGVEPVSAAPPAEAGYVQLPRNLLWAAADEGDTPEPADGFFWSATSSRLDLLLILGLRAGRPGVTVVDVSLEGGYDLAQWAGTKARPDGDDFANVLPGGELQSYHALMNHAELVRLAALCFGRIAAGADADFEENGNRIVAVHG